MRISFWTAILAVVTGVSALPQPQEKPNSKFAPALPLDIFATTPKPVEPIPLDLAAAKFKLANALFKFTNSSSSQDTGTNKPSFRISSNLAATAATCSNVRVRTEWENYSTSDRQAFVDAVKCLMGRPPSGRFRQSKSRYEDFVVIHQTLTPDVHGSAKFLLWHRYYAWAFEDILRSECGFNRSLPWFDETRYAGRFEQSSLFSRQWFGSVSLGGNCVRDGQFANLALNLGPGQSNQLHCLARNNDGSKTVNCNRAYVDQCNAWGDYASMASCAEGGPHAWGHNGIGAVMQDVWASPADPVFWLHHGFIDRNFRIWQNLNSARVSSINGRDKAGWPLTLDSPITVSDIRPTVRIRDILDTTSTTLCYKYNY